MTEKAGGAWLHAIRTEIEKARAAIETEREKLVREREELKQQIALLEQELNVLHRIELQSDAGIGQVAPERQPLSRRVIDMLRESRSELTSREMRERLGLDHRESRNLGPVLNQLMKTGKVANDGRGAPWRLV